MCVCVLSFWLCFSVVCFGLEFVCRRCVTLIFLFVLRVMGPFVSVFSLASVSQCVFPFVQICIYSQQ